MKHVKKLLVALVLCCLLGCVFVLAASAQTELAIVKQPESVFVENEGDYGRITVEATGDGLTYKWYLRDKGKTSFSLSSIKTNTIGYPVTEARDGREVYCVVTDANGNSVQTQTASFSILRDLQIVKQPEDVYVEKEGDYASVTVEARGVGLTYQWYLRDKNRTAFSLSSVTTNKIGYAITEARDGRELYCVVTDAYGNTVQSNTVMLCIKGVLAIVKQPENAIVETAGTYASVSVLARGEGLTYQWYLRDKGKTKFSLSSITTNTLGYAVNEARDGREVYCVVTDEKGNSIQSKSVIFSIRKTLAITQQPQDVKVVTPGEYASIMVEAEGSGLSYRWYLRDKGKTNFSVSSITKNKIGYPVTEARDGREVYCVVTDYFGNSVQSDVATFRIAKTLAITKQPEDAVVATAGERGTITVEAEGEGLTYKWYLKDKTKTTFSPSTITTNSISYPVNETRDGRQVYCVITDAYGNSVQSETATFSILKKLTITRQPQDAKVGVAGARGNITVVAEGEGLTYRWYLREKGKTSFSLSSITQNTIGYPITDARDGRTVYCVVSDAYGNSVTTDMATFMIIKAPEGLTAAAEGDSKVNLQWTAAKGATSYDVSYKAPDADDFVLVKTVDTTSAAVEGLSANTAYAFRVCAAADDVDPRVVSAASASVFAKTYCSADGGHVAGEAVIENEVPSTCAVEGSCDEVVYCTVCGEEISRTEKSIAKIAHTPGETVTENEVPSTCSAFGSCDEVVYCTVCGAEITRTEKQIEKIAHTPGEAVIENEIASNCAMEGNYDEVVYCTVCGEEISRTVKSLEKLPHTPASEAVRENEVPPTCSAAGSYDMVIRCTVCNEAISSETFEIPALPHTPGSIVIENEVPATCIDGGSYDEVVPCSVCGAELSRTTVETDPNQQNHVGEQQRVNVKTATCVANGNTGSVICSSCGTLIEAGHVTEKDMSNHVGELELRGAAPATCTTAGYTGDTYCLACNTVAVSGEAIPAKGHTPVTDAAVAANCGYTGLTEGSHCSVCGEVLVAQTVTPIVGSHQLGSKILSKSSSKCDVIGYAVDHYRCKVCGKYFSGSTKKEIPESSVVYYGHTWKVVEDDAYLAQPKVCGSFAVYYKTCSKCGAVNYNETGKGSSYIGHNYQPNPNHIKTEASCLTSAVYYKDCIYCGANNGTEVMPDTALGHDYSILKSVVTPSTCSETGTGIYQCSRCDATKDGVIPVNPDAHPEAKIQSDMTGVIAPTCTSPGEYYSSTVCKACGKVISQDEYHYVAPLPHNLHQIAAKAATCTTAGNIAYYSCYDCGKLFSDAAGTTEITAASTQLPALGHRESEAYERVYSRQTTCTVDGLYNEVLFCANGCGTALHTKPQQTETKFNHMKNGVSAEVAVPAAEATCLEAAHTAGTKCSLCGMVMSGLQPIADQPALGHDFSVPGNILNASAQGFYCSRCNATNPDLLGTFNTLVNSIKLTGTNNYNYNHVVTTFGKTVSSSNYNKFKSSGIVNILTDVKSEFDKEMKHTETEYATLYSDAWITAFLHLKNKDVVSMLENGDVSNVTVKKLNGLNLGSLIDSSYNGQYKDTSGNDKLTAYRNMTVADDVIAVTVTLRQETYTPANGISLVGSSGLTSLQKLTGEDIRALAEQFGENGVLEEKEEDSGYSMVSTMKLKSIVSNGSATYYFKAANYEPIAAVYDTTVVNSQDVSMKITLGPTSGSITVDPYVTEKMQSIFLFFPDNS